MTCIAWDGETLAADSLVTCEQTGDFHEQKIFELLGCLYGAAGDRIEADALLGWIREGEDPDEFPDKGEEIGIVIRIGRDRHVSLLDAGCRFWQHIVQEKFAIGSGAAYARTAMHLGHSAEAAVAVAMIFDHGTGGPITVLCLPA